MKHLNLGLGLIVILSLFTLTTTLNAQTEPDDEPFIISIITWSPDGTQYAVGGGERICHPNDKTASGIRIHDGATSEVITTLIGHNCPVESLAWSPDGTKLASTADTIGEPILIWDVKTGQLITELKGINALGGDSLNWHPDGTRIASIILPPTATGTAYIWNTVTGMVTNTEPLDGGAPTPVSQVKWSPDGRLLATVRSKGDIINIWDAQTLTLVKTLQVNHTNWVFSLDWSPDSQSIATSDRDGNILITNVNTGSTTTLSSPGRISQITWNPDGRQLAVAKPDTGIEIWDVTTEQLLETLTYEGHPYTVAWSPDGTQLIYGGWASEGDAEAVIAVPASSPRSITRFILVDADAEEDIRPLEDGDTITEGTITIRVETEPPIVGSVVFRLDDEPRFKVENEAAYALKGDDNGDYHAWLAEPGTYTLTATPYTEANGEGEAGTPLMITFTVEAPGS